MPKPKSPATLAKEAELAESIEDYRVKYANDKGTLSKPTIYFSKFGKTLKSDDPNYIVRAARMAPQVAGALRALKYKIQYPGRTGFLFRLNTCTYWNNLYIPGCFDHLMTWGGTGIQIVGTDVCDMEPGEAIKQEICTDLAVACTYPDELGKVTVWMHKDSIIAKSLVKPKAKLKMGMLPDNAPTDGLNREVLKNANDWNRLAEYIRLRQSVDNIPQPTICEIVKTISVNLANAKAQQKKEFLNTVNV